jgi:hypothetical protein
MVLAFGQLKRKLGSPGNPVNIASKLWPGRQENSGLNPDKMSNFFPLFPLNGPALGPTEIRIQLVNGEPSTELELSSFIPRNWQLTSFECGCYKYMDLHVLAPYALMVRCLINLRSFTLFCFASLCLFYFSSLYFSLDYFTLLHLTLLCCKLYVYPYIKNTIIYNLGLNPNLMH